MNKQVAATLKWRIRMKQRMVDSLGGCCVCCGYQKSLRALDFHHLDPTQKSFGFGDAKSWKWSRLVPELRKCVLLCANCHREIEDGLIEIPPNACRFDEGFVNTKTAKNIAPRVCLDCLEEYHPTSSTQKRCSGCAKSHNRVMRREYKRSKRQKETG